MCASDLEPNSESGLRPLTQRDEYRKEILFRAGQPQFPTEVCPTIPKVYRCKIQPLTTHPTKEFVNATQDFLSDLHR